MNALSNRSLAALTVAFCAMSVLVSIAARAAVTA